MTINNEAVEAATKAVLEAWGYGIREDKGLSADLRIALEAAAPFIRADAGAKALEDAAEEADKTSANIINNNINLYPAWDGMAEGWKNAATRLRARAAAVRGEG